MMEQLLPAAVVENAALDFRFSRSQKLNGTSPAELYRIAMVDPHGSGVGAETLGVAHVKGPFAGSFLLYCC